MPGQMAEFHFQAVMFHQCLKENCGVAMFCSSNESCDCRYTIGLNKDIVPILDGAFAQAITQAVHDCVHLSVGRILDVIEMTSAWLLLS